MISPFEGRVTAQWRGYPGHKGTDVAPPKPGQTGMPVYAAFAGTVIKTSSGNPHGNRKSTWAPGRTGDGVLIRNRDNEAQGYNHMRPVVSVGDKIVEGQLIGYNNTSGNQTGPHVHFECWASYKNSNSDYDARLCFNKFGVVAGSAPKRVVTVKPHNTNTSLSTSVKNKLRAMGYSKFGKTQIKAYQRWHGVKATGVWDKATERMYQTVISAQNATKLMAGVPDSWKSDGYWGKTSKKWAAYTSGRNGWNNPKGYLTTKFMNHLKKVGAWA